MTERNAEGEISEAARAHRQQGIKALDFAISVGIPIRVVDLGCLGLLNLGGETERYTEDSIDQIIAEEWGLPQRKKAILKPTLDETSLTF